MGNLRVRAGSLAAVAWLTAVTLPAGAATFTVASTADQVDAIPGDGICAAGGGACTLRAAIMEANAIPGSDTVNLPAGTFRLFPTGTNEDAGERGDLDVTESLTVAGAGVDQTIIDGSGADRVFDLVDGTDFVLTNLTVRRGSPAGQNGGAVRSPGPGAIVITSVRFERNTAGSGAAVYQDDGPLTITTCTFDNNVAGYYGGAVYKGGSGALEVRGSVFSDNQSGGPGGSIGFNGPDGVTIVDCQFNASSGGTGGSVSVESSYGLIVNNSTFIDSQSSGNGGALYFRGPGPVSINVATFTRGVAAGSGGAVSIESGANLELHNSIFTDNLTGYTGGALTFYSADDGAVIADSVFTGNSAFGGSGGALYVYAGGGVTLANLEVRSNACEGAGGGTFLQAGEPTTIDGVRMIDNVASDTGGGMYANINGGGTVLDATFANNRVAEGDGGGLWLVGGGPFTVQRSTFSGNVIHGADAQGGGLLLSSGEQSHVENVTFSANQSEYRGGGFYVAGSVTAYSTTFSDNAAAEGGALYNGSQLRISNTILAATISGDNCAGNQVESGNRNIDTDGSCALDGPSDQEGVDPQLGPLADNGGPSPTHALTPGSPAIDNGNPAVCPSTDQRGIARPADGNGDGDARCDIGAYEYFDQCPGDPNKVDPGACGCGNPDADSNGNGVADCLANAELKARIAEARTTLDQLTTERTPAQKALRAALKRLALGLTTYVNQHRKDLVLTDPKAKLPRLAKLAGRALKAAARKTASARTLDGVREKANQALTKLDDAVAE